MFSSKEELNELENESLTATGSPFGEITHSRRIYMENRFISINTPNLFSVVLIEHLRAQHLDQYALTVDLKAWGRCQMLKSCCVFSVRLWI